MTITHNINNVCRTKENTDKPIVMMKPTKENKKC